MGRTAVIFLVFFACHASLLRAQAPVDLKSHVSVLSGKSLGSGVVVGKTKASGAWVVLTCAHCLSEGPVECSWEEHDADSVTVRKVRCRRIAIDHGNDLALLFLDTKDRGRFKFTPVKLAAKPAATGDHVRTISSPSGWWGTTTFGRVSFASRFSKGQVWDQLSVKVQPGSSGGAVLNEKGELAGIIQSVTNNITWSVPVSRITHLLDAAEVVR